MRHLFKGMAIGAALVATAAYVNPADAEVRCLFGYYDVVADVMTIYPSQSWLVGDTQWLPSQTSFPAPLPPIIEDFQVNCIANGPELSFIRQNFSGLRDNKLATEVTFTGDEARFLFKNLTASGQPPSPPRHR